jgi:cobalamin biosynthetic protein CobC
VVQAAVHRIQPKEMTAQAIEWMREVGIDLINIDLIYGLPHQTPETFAKTLDEVIEFNPDRLAVFSYAHILAPTYNEFAAAFDAEGWRVEEAAAPDRLAGCAAAVVVNPNNPDGRCLDPAALIALAGAVGLLIVDESFADPHPEVSLAGMGLPDNLLVLRSFGKFYGLAGARLGFVLGADAPLSTLARLAGPWPVSGPALALGAAALADTGWCAAAIARLNRDAARLDAMVPGAGWRLVGGTALFRLYDTGGAAAAQARLARARIWSRVFPYSASWLRLGLPGPEAEWERLAAVLA